MLTLPIEINQTACGHPAPKDGVCFGPHARFYGIQKSSSFRCPDPLDQNYRNSVFGSQRGVNAGIKLSNYSGIKLSSST